MRKLAFAALLCAGYASGQTEPAAMPTHKGTFTGTLKLSPAGDGVHMKVLEPISYTDWEGHRIEVPASFSTDGASIPRALWTVVGSPFSGGNYVEAAVIHDQGCVSHTLPWRVTHRIFYYAMIDSGVDPRYAKLLYYGVRFGGPKWEVKKITATGNLSKRTTTTRVVYLSTRQMTEREVTQAQELISAREAGGNPLSLDEIDQEADKRPPVPIIQTTLPPF